MIRDAAGRRRRERERGAERGGGKRVKVVVGGKRRNGKGKSFDQVWHSTAGKCGFFRRGGRVNRSFVPSNPCASLILFILQSSLLTTTMSTIHMYSILSTSS